MGQLKGVTGRQMFCSSKKNPAFLRSFVTTEPKYWPEAVQLLSELICPATALIPVYGFDPEEQKVLDPTSPRINLNLAFFLPNGHKQICDICQQSLLHTQHGKSSNRRTDPNS